MTQLIRFSISIEEDLIRSFDALCQQRGWSNRSEAGTKTPLSCLNDGVQIGSGCTAGKGNLSIVGSGAARVRFTADDGRHVAIELLQSVIDEFPGSDLIEKSTELATLSLKELFTWTTQSS